MARTMHNVVVRQMKVVLQQNKFNSINCDEITTINNQFGFLCMPMLLQNWRRQPFFLNLERAVDKAHIVILLLLLFIILLVCVVYQWLTLLTRLYALGQMVYNRTSIN
jgi:hypothetical protein